MKLNYFAKPKLLHLYLMAAAFSLLVSGALLLPRELIFDEAHYLRNTVGFVNGEVGVFSFQEQHGPTGPLYAWFHALIWSCIPSVVALRLGNTVLMLASILLVSKRGANWLFRGGFLLLSFPGIFVSSGMALTEMVSVFFVSLSIYSLRSEAKWSKVIGAFFIGLAALSRQTLVTNASGFLPGVFKQDGRWRAVLSFLLPLLITAPMFFAWGGLLPEDENKEIIGRFPLSSLSVVLGIGYSIVLALVTIKLDIRPIKFVHPGFAILAALLSFGMVRILDWRFLPIKSISVKLFGDSADLLESVFPSACLWMLAVLASTLIKKRDIVREWTIKLPSIEWHFLLMYLIVVGTNVGISHQFSTRYLVVGAPFLAAFLSNFQVRILGIILLIIANFLSLASYAW